MFVTGRAQRVGSKRAGTHIRNAISTAAGIPASQQFEQGAGKQSSKRSRIATIGGGDTVGLVIKGRYEREEALGTNPDDRDIPLEGESLVNPDYNISYSGIGTLKFASPIRVPVIDGPLAINNGSLHVNGSINTNEGYYLNGQPIESSLPPPIITDFSTTLDLAGGGTNFIRDDANTSAVSWSFLGLVHIRIRYSWSSKNAATGGMRFKGLPFDMVEPESVIGQVVSVDHNTTIMGSVLSANGEVGQPTFIRIMDFNQDLKDFLHVQASTFDEVGQVILNFTYQTPVV